jgi:hypothetical protein
VATVDKGKSVRRAPVNEEIVEDLLQRMEQSWKKSLRKLSLQANVPLEKTWTSIHTKSQHFKNFDQVILRDARILQLVFEQFEWWQVPNNEFELNILIF